MKHAIFAVALLCAAGPASAYTAYILPEDFTPEAQTTLQAAYAGTFFTPDIGLPADLRVLLPDTVEGSFDRVEASANATTAQLSLQLYGTYRITTGERLGPVTTLVAESGSWRPLAQGETPAEGAETTTIQTVTNTLAYVSRGAPTRGAVDAPSGTLNIHPITHPNEVVLANGFQVELRFNGQPFANMPLVVYEAGDADSAVDTYFVTDAQGRATLTFPQTGRYVVAARHRGPATEGAQSQIRSYTTTLTFEVIDAIPAYPAPPTQEPQNQRRRSLYRGP